MAENTLLELFPEINYAIVMRTDEDFVEYVAAWGYDIATGTWGQGHYFTSLIDAAMYIKRQQIIIESATENIGRR